MQQLFIEAVVAYVRASWNENPLFSCSEQLAEQPYTIWYTLASPAMGHWGTCPPPSTFSLLFWRSLTLQTLTSHAHGFLSSRAFSGHRFCRGKFKLGGTPATSINFWPIFVIFCPQFSSGSNYSSQNAVTIANKFQLHTYFRFR